MKTVFFVIYNEGHYRELIRVIRRMADLDSIKILALFEYKYANIDEHINELLSLNVLCFDGCCNPITATEDDMALSPIASPIPEDLEAFPFFQRLKMRFVIKYFPDALNQYRAYLGWEKRNHDFLSTKKPDVIFLSEATLNYPMGMLWINVSKKLNIKSIIVPFGLMGLPYNPEMVRFYSEDATRRVNENSRLEKLVSFFVPRMVSTYKGIRVFRMPLEDVISAKLIGIVPRLPWNPNSSNVTAIAVESQAMKALYMKAGFPRGQLKTVGSMYYDQMATLIAEIDTKKQEFREKSDIPASHRIAICGFPPNQFGSSTDTEEGIDDFDSIVALYADVFSQIKDWTIIVNPHPRVQGYDFSPLEELENVVITNQDIIDLIPFGDIYIGASGSSTIRVSVACGKPTINYDVYGYKQIQYKDVPGIFDIKSKDELFKVIWNLTQDASYFDEQQALVNKSAESWGKIDGNAFNRLMKLIEK